MVAIKTRAPSRMPLRATDHLPTATIILTGLPFALAFRMIVPLYFLSKAQAVA
jgi:hypothetical protein